MGRIIAVANQKGGVGKTTTVINLAAYLADSGKRVLAVDIDPQGNTTTGLGIEKHTVDASIYDVLLEGQPLMEALVPTDVVGLHLVPATMDLAGAEVDLSKADHREMRLKAALMIVKERYDYIFIDCPPSLGLLTVNALCAADRVMIPIQCEFFALEGLSQLLSTIELVKSHLNPTLALEGILLTMFDGRTNLATQVADEVRNHFTSQVYQSVIPRTVRLSEAPSHGLPIMRYDPKSRGAEGYRALAEEVMAHG
ncbi:ParA family protein [Sulfobacillus sp. hq2]|uniref:ParA family protein n=1 Tax=Sulfobacillus TaxID=28033 RepID=UPI000CD27436|nr:AAA family ATPase [Sulfobacillus sp. hq2]POB12070.1 sporulation initiation inhibitor Soj [Sulfobacillus sp. hq2]